MRHQISVSKEYIETVCEWLETWSNEETSWTIPQFLKKHGIGWSYFKGMMEIDPLLHNRFQITIATLHDKWISYAFEKKELPFHLQKIMMRYLRIYDNHSFYVEQQARNGLEKAKKELEENADVNVNEYTTEDYSQERLDGLYKRIYDENVNKRRSRASSKRI